MGRELIVGGGTGGLTLANLLARRLSMAGGPDGVEVTVVADRDRYLYQPGLLYLPFDLAAPEELERPVRQLLHPAVRFVHSRVRRIDPRRKAVEAEGDVQLGYDFLVLATGSFVHPEEVPGLAEGAHHFYTLEGALRLREALRRFQGGRVVLTIGVPHKCPAAPLEFVLMLEDWARRRGIRDRTEIVYTYPVGRAHVLEPVAAWAESEFAARGIQWEPFFNPESVDPAARTVSSLEGSSFPYDLLVAVPPHVGAQALADSGLAVAGNWLPAHRGTLAHPDWPDVYGLGDATDLPVSKAGSTAHYQAEVLAENLFNQLRGGAPARHYDGKVFCFIEAGLDRATSIEFTYDRPPRVGAPSRSVHWFKQAYNRIHWLNLQAIV
jgi:sulfide:quinone oxidoreductase